jgi:hypothetical protein
VKAARKSPSPRGEGQERAFNIVCSERSTAFLPQCQTREASRQFLLRAFGHFDFRRADILDLDGVGAIEVTSLPLKSILPALNSYFESTPSLIQNFTDIAPLMLGISTATATTTEAHERFRGVFGQIAGDYVPS